MWTIEHEADIASDLSAFHRVDDPMTLDGPTYFSRAHRLAAYAGVMQSRVIAQQQEDAPAPRSASSPAAPAHVPDTVALAMLAGDERYQPERVESPA